MRLRGTSFSTCQRALSNILNAKEATKYLSLNNNDAPSITKYGFLVQPDTQVVALHAHCTILGAEARAKECFAVSLSSLQYIHMVTKSILPSSLFTPQFKTDSSCEQNAKLIFL